MATATAPRTAPAWPPAADLAPAAAWAAWFATTRKPPPSSVHDPITPRPPSPPSPAAAETAADAAAAPDPADSDVVSVSDATATSAAAAAAGVPPLPAILTRRAPDPREDPETRRRHALRFASTFAALVRATSEPYLDLLLDFEAHCTAVLREARQPLTAATPGDASPIIREAVAFLASTAATPLTACDAETQQAQALETAVAALKSAQKQQLRVLVRLMAQAMDDKLAGKPPAAAMTAATAGAAAGAASGTATPTPPPASTALTTMPTVEAAAPSTDRPVVPSNASSAASAAALGAPGSPASPARQSQPAWRDIVLAGFARRCPESTFSQVAMGPRPPARLAKAPSFEAHAAISRRSMQRTLSGSLWHVPTHQRKPPPPQGPSSAASSASSSSASTSSARSPSDAAIAPPAAHVANDTPPSSSSSGRRPSLRLVTPTHSTGLFRGRRGSLGKDEPPPARGPGGMLRAPRHRVVSDISHGPDLAAPRSPSQFLTRLFTRPTPSAAAAAKAGGPPAAAGGSALAYPLSAAAAPASPGRLLSAGMGGVANALRRSFRDLSTGPLSALAGPTPARLPSPSQAPELSETFSATIGQHDRTMLTFRLLACPATALVDGAAAATDDAGDGEGDEEGEGDDLAQRAMRSQTWMALYGSKGLNGIVVITPVHQLHSPAAAAAALTGGRRLPRCELHFDDIEVQIAHATERRRAERAAAAALATTLSGPAGAPGAGDGVAADAPGDPSLGTNEAESPWADGDVFLTRHSNLPGVHVVFHIVSSRPLPPVAAGAVAAAAAGAGSRARLADVSPTVLSGLRHSVALAAEHRFATLRIPLMLLEALPPALRAAPLWRSGHVMRRRTEAVLRAVRAALTEWVGAATRHGHHAATSPMAATSADAQAVRLALTRHAIALPQITLAIPSDIDRHEFYAIRDQLTELFRTN
ncbi:hypothetical protein CXG81DRAFT_28100 [Caulochytrium protostelioides]|uniref:Uncharacterized protein n=1 Tax=Caulochytrium protostelioides TaxID=1555241 RepID=A0A4P9X2R2_9FUNG|nr:hypothetical protein CXG81DRAFT_28100 [Caulochytrium protostelioides]|eukprot:RKO99120.1 hypothetical protein CXG81DRAFT_28100 [Caulochytrium protostelioides]